MWTSVQELGYMCVTAHYIDANFNLKKKIISFKKVKYPHTSAAIEETLSKCLTEWGIKRKLFTLTLDNAANNKLAVDSFVQHQDHGMLFGGVDFNVRCSAHILNILVQDGTRYVHRTIEKIRELLRHIVSSPSRIQSFNAIAVNLDLAEKAGGINLDIPNRWNSTYLMIGEALEYKGAFNNYASGNGEIAPDDVEWTNVEVLCAFLKAFEEATKFVSADRTPTTHLFLHMVLCIRHALRDPKWSSSGTMSNLVYAMGQKFDKYWKESKPNVAVVIATVLDPTKKSYFLEFFFEKYYENVDDIDKCLEGVKDMMKSYYEKYEEARRTTEHSVSRQVSANIRPPVLGKRRLEEEFAQYKSRRRSYMQPKSELNMYLDENFESSGGSFDILIWWKTHAEKYPMLSTMARDFLAIPLSTVSSESAFSCSGRTLGDSQCSMTPETLEALVCAKDWLIKIPNNEGPSGTA